MRKFLIAVLILLSAPLAISQGVRYDLPPVISPRGLPIPNIQVSLCPGTAVISGSTCGTTAQAFTDQSLNTPCTSGLPVTPPNLQAPQGVGVCSATGDSLGNAGFWLSPGSYIYCLNGPSITGKCYNLTAYAGGSTLNVTTSLAGCYAALPSSGGTCVVPPGYTETLTSSLTMNKNSAGFLFMGPATITMGTNQIIVPANNFGSFIKGTVPYGGIPGGSNGAVFNYSGSGIAILVGASPGATTRVFSMENIGINLTVANAATGLYLKNVVYFDLKNLLISGSSGVGSTGIVCDGTGNFCGNGTITNLVIQFIQTGILGTGSGGANSMNALTIIGGTIQSGSSSPMANSIGIDTELGFQDNVWGLDIEEEAIAIKFGAGATFENYEIRSESCTQDMNAVAGSANNRLSIRAQGATFSLNTADAGQGNIVGYTNSNASNTFQSGTLSGSISTTTLIQPVNSVKNFVVTATIYQNGIGIGCTGNTTIRAVVGASYNNGIGQNGYNVAGWSTASSTIADPAVLSVGNGTLANVIEYLPVTLSNLSGTTPVTIATTYTAGSGCSTPPTYYLIATVLPIK